MEQFNLPVSMLRQHCFCPRIPFFQLMRGIQPVGPMWLQQGLNHHVREEMLANVENYLDLVFLHRVFDFLKISSYTTIAWDFTVSVTALFSLRMK